MVLINHELKAIYVHVPKTGGLYVKYILKKYYGFDQTVNAALFSEKHQQFVHNNINDTDPKYLSVTNITIGGVLRYFMSSPMFNNANNMDETKWKTYKKFAIIRCPYDRIVSAYCQCTDNVNKKLTIEPKPQYDNLKDFLIRYKQREMCISPHDNYSYMHSIIPQYDHLIDINNEMNIDYIGKFDSLNEDLCDILIKLGVKDILHSNEITINYKENKSTARKNYINYYDETTLELVNQICETDFANFNQYTIKQNIDELKENDCYVDDTKLRLNNKKALKKIHNNPAINVVTPKEVIDPTVERRNIRNALAAEKTAAEKKAVEQKIAEELLAEQEENERLIAEEKAYKPSAEQLLAEKLIAEHERLICGDPTRPDDPIPIDVFLAKP